MGSSKKELLKIKDCKQGQWLALDTKEFGWIAGVVQDINKKSFRFRIMRRKVNSEAPSLKTLEGWDECSCVTVQYFFESPHFPRALMMGFKSPKT